MNSELTATAIISTAGAVSGTGTFIYGTLTPGDYSISLKTGSNTTCTSITFSLPGPGTCGTGCTFSNVVAQWDNGTIHTIPFSITTDYPTILPKHFKIGGTANYNNTVPIGTNNSAYSLSIQDAGSTASTFPEIASIGFDTQLTINTITSPNLGSVRAATAGVYKLSTAGAVTPSGGGVLEAGTPTAGSYTVVGSATQLINFSVSGYTTSGVSTPSAATCAYNGGASTANCAITGGAAPGTGKPLLVGLTVTTTAGGTDGETDTPSLTLAIIYQ